MPPWTLSSEMQTGDFIPPYTALLNFLFAICRYQKVLRCIPPNTSWLIQMPNNGSSFYSMMNVHNLPIGPKPCP